MPYKHCKLKLVVAAAALLALPACDDGWTTRDYSGTPYGQERTAGYGVEYVRAHLLPERGPALESVAAPDSAASPVITPEPEEMAAPEAMVAEGEAGSDYTNDLLQEGEVMFEKQQRK